MQPFFAEPPAKVLSTLNNSLWNRRLTICIFPIRVEISKLFLFLSTSRGFLAALYSFEIKKILNYYKYHYIALPFKKNII